MLIINNELVSQLLTMEDCIRVQEEAFRKLPDRRRDPSPAHRHVCPGRARRTAISAGARWRAPTTAIFAIRMKSDIITWPKDENGNWTEEKYCREPGTYCGLIFLVSTRNAEPLAFINDGVLQHMRVGGGAGIGVKYLSREDTHVVGMLGSGGMARTFLEAFKCVRDMRLCKVYSPTPAAPRGVRARRCRKRAQHRGARGRRSARGGARRRSPVLLHRQHGSRSTTPTGSSRACTSPISAAAKCRTRAPTNSTSSCARAPPACR